MPSPSQELVFQEHSQKTSRYGSKLSKPWSQHASTVNFNRHQRDQPIVTYRPTQLLDRAAFLRQWWHPCAETVYEARQKLSRKTSGRGWMGNRGTHQTNRCFGVGIKIIKAIARYYADICHDLWISIIKTHKIPGQITVFQRRRWKRRSSVGSERERNDGGSEEPACLHIHVAILWLFRFVCLVGCLFVCLCVLLCFLMCCFDVFRLMLTIIPSS